MLVLASGSKYRQKQLSDLGLKFTAERPTADEEALKTQWMQQQKGALTLAKSQKLAAFLSEEKAKSVWASKQTTRDLFVVGSDQLVFFDGQILGKPGDASTAFRQLKKMSGKTHSLVTAVSICYGRDKAVTKVITARVKMNKLSSDEIEKTLEKDEPYDCAGAYKLESMGLTLIESITVSDSTSLIGLPVVTMLGLLRKLKAKLEFI